MILKCCQVNQGSGLETLVDSIMEKSIWFPGSNRSSPVWRVAIGSSILTSHHSMAPLQLESLLCEILFPNDDISKAFDVTQLVAVEVDQ